MDVKDRWEGENRMRGRRVSAGLSALILIGVAATACQTEKPPAARRSAHFDTYHGQRVADPYDWMEGEPSPELQTWVRLQDGYARAWVAETGLQNDLKGKLLAAARHQAWNPPVKRGGRYFSTRFSAGFTRVWLVVRDSLQSEPRELLTAETLDQQGLVLAPTVWPSPDGRWVAFGVHTAASRRLEIRILDAESGEWLPDRLDGAVSGLSSVSWIQTSDGFYYDRFPDSPNDALVDERVLFHRLRSPQDSDQPLAIPDRTSETLVNHAISGDGRFLVITAREGGQSGDRVHFVDLDRRSRHLEPLVTLAEASFVFLGSRGRQLYFYTNLEAPRGRIVRVDPERQEDGWETVVAQSDETIDTWPGSVTMAGDSLLALYRRDSALVLKRFDLDGDLVSTVDPPKLGSIWSGLVGRPGDPEVFFTLGTFTDPGTVYRLDLRNGGATPLWKPRLPYDTDDYVTKLVYYSGPAGPRIPMYLGYRRGLEPDGRRPVMMYGYGTFNWVASPWFRPHLAEWMSSGGVFALPALRGGGEYGERWHQDGIGRNRQNAIDDYLAAARWLIDEGLASPRTLVAETNSAGASLVATALVQRPKLFGAGVIAFPLLDLLEYENSPHGPRWRSELGTVADPVDFESLRASSPVHNVTPGCYPPILLLPGEKDDTTPASHAYKFAAVLQHAQNCPNPILLRVSWGGGHAYGRDADETAENFADQLCFLNRALNLSSLPEASPAPSASPK